MPTLGDQTGADQYLVQRPVQVVLVEEQEGTDHTGDEDVPGKAVTTLKAHPSLLWE